jgi:ribonuclease HI
MSSFRAEAVGLLAGILLLRLLTINENNSAANEIHTDSASLLSCLTRAISNYVPVGFWLKPDSDVVQQIVQEAKQIHQLERTYVKGHQDLAKDKKDYTAYNIAADTEATIMRYAMLHPVGQVVPFPASRVNIYIDNQHISSSHNRFMHEAYTINRYWQYWKRNFIGAHRRVDW